MSLSIIATTGDPFVTDDSIFGSIPEAYDEVRSASDEELVRIVIEGDDRGLGTPNGWQGLTLEAMATFALRERGYVVTGAPGEVEVRDPEGEPVVLEGE